MFKNILKLSKDDKLVFDTSVRPFIIFCILIVSIVVIDSVFNTISDDMVNGYIYCLILNMAVTYGNLCFIDYKESVSKNKEKMKEED